MLANNKRTTIPLVRYPRGIFLGEVLDRVLSANAEDELVFSTAAETGLGPAVLEFVRQDLGIGWLPESMVARDVRGGQLAMMDDILPSFTLDVVIVRLIGPQTRINDGLWNEIQLELNSNSRHLRLYPVSTIGTE